MNEAQKVIAWSEAEFVKIFHNLPAIVKQYGAEGLHVTAVIKQALASPEAAGVLAELQQMFPGSWEAETVQIIEKAIGVAVPELNALVLVGGGTVDILAQFVGWVKTLSPKMQHSAILKLLSAMFQALDPSLSEVASDTAAQIVYTKTTATA